MDCVCHITRTNTLSSVRCKILYRIVTAQDLSYMNFPNTGGRRSYLAARWSSNNGYVNVFHITPVSMRKIRTKCVSNIIIKINNAVTLELVLLLVSRDDILVD
jgi:hypothetical protein